MASEQEIIYKITYFLRGKEKRRRFDTLEAANKVAQAIYEATGVVVGIEREG